MIKRIISVVALAALALWAWTSWPAASPEQPASASQQHEVATSPGPRTPVATDYDPTTDVALADTRVERTPALGASRVTNDRGEPVAGAVISATPFEPAFFVPWAGWDRQDWSAVLSLTTHTTSGADGAFDLPINPAEEPIAVWVTHPRHLPAHVLLGPGQTANDLPSTLELTPAAAMRVRVVDAFGNGVPDAEVEQCLPIPSDVRADLHEPQAERLLMRTWRTDAAGFVDVFACDEPVLLRARGPGGVSDAWTGEPRAAVQLVLRPTFTAHGTLTYAQGTQLMGDPRVRVFAQVGAEPVLLATLTSEGTTWGPVELPLIEGADTYRFRLEGWDATVEESLHKRPRAGGELTVDFTVQQGKDLWFLVTDEEQNPLSDSSVRVFWDSGGIETSVVGRPFDTEYILTRGIPNKIVNCTASAVGYADATVGPYAIPFEGDDLASIVMLDPGGTLRGRVVHDGAPVESFEITSWPLGSSLALTTEAFANREDGSFEVSGVGIGKLAVIASAPGLSPSAIEYATVGENEFGEVEIELANGAVGRGRVIDASTREPIADAVLQAFAMGNGYRAMTPAQAPVRARHDGSFEVTCAQGRGRVRVTAPGYATSWQESFGVDGEADLGVVALHGRQPLRVQLVSDSELNAEQYELWGYGCESIPITKFDASGRLTIPDLSPGVYYVRLRHDDGKAIESTAVLEPGEDWSLTLPVRGESRLVVRLKDEADFKPGMWALLECFGDGSRSWRHGTELLDGGWVEFDSVQPGRYSVQVFSAGQGDQIATASGTIEAGALVTEALVELGDSFAVAVADRSGAPVVSANVALVSADDPNKRLGSLTDPDGVAAFHGMSAGTFRVAVWHRDFGYQFNGEIELESGRAEPARVTFDPSLALEAQLLDGSTPLEGVTARIWDEHGLYSVPPKSSDHAGLVSWDRLGEGGFTLSVGQKGFWPTSVELTTRPAGTPHVVQVRRLGDLTIHVLGATSQRIDLRSEEFDTDVSSWIGDGSVAAPSGLVSGADGMIRLSGLPNGTYTWEAVAPQGELAGGMLTVEPGLVTEVTISVP